MTRSRKTRPATIPTSCMSRKTYSERCKIVYILIEYGKGNDSQCDRIKNKGFQTEITIEMCSNGVIIAIGNVPCNWAVLS